MVLFVWGEDYIDPSVFDEGLATTEIMQDYGFQNGDKILNVNQEPLDSQIDINKFLLLRSVETVEVKHPDGSVEVIELPDDIGQKLFQSGEMQSFSPVRKPLIDSVKPDTPAMEAGLKKGDLITSVNGKKIEYWHEFTEMVEANKGENIRIGYVNSVSENKALNRELNTEGMQEVSVTTTDEGMVGVYVKPLSESDIKTKAYTLGESVSAGFDYAYWTLHDYVAQFKYVFTEKGATQVGGFGAIGSLFPDAWDWQAFWTTTAFISIILAFMNILPIPALDGGHVMFLLYEMISGRKPNEKVMEYAQMIGFFVLIALVLFANGNDVYRWLTGG